MKILNLYAGIGGNRKLWKNCAVTAIEHSVAIKQVYEDFFPEDIAICTDARAYLLRNFRKFDFIWSSPPCQSHGKMVKFSRHKPVAFPDLSLYEQVLFLREFFKGKWVVENVDPYYETLIPPSTKIGRHLFWANFPIPPFRAPRPPSNFINLCDMKGKKILMDWLDMHYEKNVYYGDNHCPAQILRNCVHPLLGQHILNEALK